MNEAASQSAAAPELFGSDRMWGLKELPLPEPVSWWPQTTGWLILGIVLLLIAGWISWRFWRRYQRNAYRRHALARLETMEIDPAALAELPALLRKSALAAEARETVAGLRGRAWVDWLNAGARRPLFSDADAAVLDQLAYNAKAAASLDEPLRQHLVDASKAWMRSHRAAI